jgi:hypothetical protein
MRSERAPHDEIQPWLKVELLVVGIRHERRLPQVLPEGREGPEEQEVRVVLVRRGGGFMSGRSERDLSLVGSIERRLILLWRCRRHHEFPPRVCILFVSHAP